VLGVPVVRPRMIETTALGAGLLAARALGWRDAGKDARRVDRRFPPRAPLAERRRGKARWRAALACVRAAGRLGHAD
jgi:glycerol kinase